ncbi:MAG: NAD(P)-dependent oxidoreductase [Rhodoglobus sp.]
MTATERVGLLGLGRMGLPIARGLLSAGYAVVAWDPVPGRRELAATAGVTSAVSAADAAASADILITVLPGTPELEAAMVEALPALRPGSLWLDLTSTDPRIAESLAARARERDVAAVGAPMGGGVQTAESRALRFFAGGAVERARPLLESLGTIDHVGTGIGDGYTAKLIANLLWFGQAVAVTEALLLGQSLGIAPERLRQSLAASAGGSVFLDEYVGHLFDGDYLVSFGIERVVEELDTLASLARAHSVPFELSELVARLHREAFARFGAIDGELLAAKLLEERAGRDLRR